MQRINPRCDLHKLYEPPKACFIKLGFNTNMLSIIFYKCVDVLKIVTDIVIKQTEESIGVIKSGVRTFAEVCFLYISF